MSRRTRTPVRAAAARAALTALAAAALAGCGVIGGSDPAPTWVPKPNALPPVGQPNPELPGGSDPTDPSSPGQPSPQPSPGEEGDPNVIATKLAAPWGLVIMPDGTALVGERTTGKILRVDPAKPGATPKVEQTVAGVDPAGDGGLLGLALSPAYAEDRLVFAYVTTKTDNRVVKFELGKTPSPVLTGLPKGRTGNGGQLAFGPDDQLYVTVGDTGTKALAQQTTSYAGKILRVTEFGKPSQGNPTAGSPIWSLGHASVTGLCWDAQKRLYAVEDDGPAAEVNLVEKGKNYGWPTVTGRAGKAGLEDPKLELADATAPLGGCAVIGYGLFIGALDGTQVLAAALDGKGQPSTPKPLLKGVYGRIRTVVAAPDGALWLTTSNKDGQGKPVADDERVIRIVPPPDSTTSPV